MRGGEHGRVSGCRTKDRVPILHGRAASTAAVRLDEREGPGKHFPPRTPQTRTARPGPPRGAPGPGRKHFAAASAFLVLGAALARALDALAGLVGDAVLHRDGAL